MNIFKPRTDLGMISISKACDWNDTSIKHNFYTRNAMLKNREPKKNNLKLTLPSYHHKTENHLLSNTLTTFPFISVSFGVQGF